MYCQHFNLEKKPFQLSSDNAFLWLGETHARALGALKQGIQGDSGLLVLTGDVGTGKTTLLHEIIHTLTPGTACAHITDPSMELHHLFSILAEDLGFRDGFDPEKKMRVRFQHFLTALENENRKALLIIDEAHLIHARFLKELMSWAALGPGRVFTILLAGQLEFHQVMAAALGKAWNDRVDVHARLAPLDEQETKTYINRRLELAGAQRKIFIVAAVRQIHAFSKGIPRRINMACDQAMIAAFSKDMKIIDVPTLNEALGILDLPVQAPKPDEKPKQRSLPPPMLAAGIALLAITGFIAYAGFIRQSDIPQVPQIVSAPLPDRLESDRLEPDPGKSDPAALNQTEPYRTEPDQAKEDKIVQAPPEPAQTDHSVSPAEAPGEKLPDPPAPPAPLQAPPESYSPPKTDEFTADRTVRRERSRPDLEDFVSDVFMVQTTEEELEAPEVFELKGTVPNQAGEPAKPNREKKAETSKTEDPDPRAVIDWLLEKRRTR